MEGKVMLLLILLFTNLPFVQLVCSGEPEVYWGFEGINATNLIPSYTKDQRFYSNITGSDAVFVPGVSDNGIHMPRTSIVLAKNLRKDDCLLDVDSCLEICMTFNLKLMSWSPDGHNSILATLPTDKSKPGMYFGKGDCNAFMIYIRGQDGTTYKTTFSKNYAMDKWARFLINWNKENKKIRVEANGTDLNLETKETKVGDSGVSEIISMKSELLLGEKGGPEFYFDEFTVYYTRNDTKTVTTPPSVQTTIKPSATTKDVTATQQPHATTKDGTVTQQRATTDTTFSDTSTSSASSMMVDVVIIGSCIGLAFVAPIHDGIHIPIS